MTNGRFKSPTAVPITMVHSHTEQTLFEITEDKLRLTLNEHINSLESSKEWYMPASLLVTIVLVLCTADFRTVFGIPSNTWSAIFILMAAGTLIWLIHSLLKKKSAMSVDDIINQFRNKTTP